MVIVQALCGRTMFMSLIPFTTCTLKEKEYNEERRHQL